MANIGANFKLHLICSISNIACNSLVTSLFGVTLGRALGLLVYLTNRKIELKLKKDFKNVPSVKRYSVAVLDVQIFSITIILNHRC